LTGKNENRFRTSRESFTSSQSKVELACEVKGRRDVDDTQIYCSRDENECTIQGLRAASAVPIVIPPPPIPAGRMPKDLQKGSLLFDARLGYRISTKIIHLFQSARPLMDKSNNNSLNHGGLKDTGESGKVCNMESIDRNRLKTETLPKNGDAK